MTNAPRLINNRFTTLLPNTLFSDLEIDSLPRLLGDLESAI